MRRCLLLRQNMGGVSILLILYAIQIYLGTDTVPKKHGADIWIDNEEVLSRGNDPEIKDSVKEHLVLDFDMWRVMNMLQGKIVIPTRWNKVDSHIKSQVGW